MLVDECGMHLWARKVFRELRALRAAAVKEEHDPDQVCLEGAMEETALRAAKREAENNPLFGLWEMRVALNVDRLLEEARGMEIDGEAIEKQAVAEADERVLSMAITEQGEVEEPVPAPAKLATVKEAIALLRGSPWQMGCPDLLRVLKLCPIRVYVRHADGADWAGAVRYVGKLRVVKGLWKLDTSEIASEEAFALGWDGTIPELTTVEGLRRAAAAGPEDDIPLFHRDDLGKAIANSLLTGGAGQDGVIEESISHDKLLEQQARFGDNKRALLRALFPEVLAMDRALDARLGGKCIPSTRGRRPESAGEPRKGRRTFEERRMAMLRPKVEKALDVKSDLVVKIVPYDQNPEYRDAIKKHLESN